MRRCWSLLALVSIAAFIAVPASAKPPAPCAIVANFDTGGKFDPKAIADARCEPSQLLLISACNLDANNPHKLKIFKRMRHKGRNKVYEMLGSEIVLPVKAFTAAMPDCVTKTVFLPPKGDFDDGDVMKKAYGPYGYGGTADSVKFDPDLDVVVPGSLNPITPRRPAAGRGRGNQKKK